MEIINKIDNKLFNRKEIIATVISDSTPTGIGMLEEFSKEFKVDKEVVVIISIKGKFGTNKFTVSVKIYDDIGSKEKYEVITRKAKKKQAEAKKKAEEEAKKAKEEEKAKAEEEKKAAEEAKTEEKPVEESKTEDTKLEENKSEEAK